MHNSALLLDEQVPGLRAQTRCLQVCYAAEHWQPQNSHTRQHRCGPTHQHSHTSQQHPLPAAGVHLLQLPDCPIRQTFNHQLVQLRPAVCAQRWRVGCGWHTWRQEMQLKEDGQTSPWEEGELLQALVSVQGGLVHLQHTQRAGRCKERIEQQQHAFELQHFSSARTIRPPPPAPTLARSCGREWMARQECRRLRLSSLLGRQSYTRARASGTRSVRMRPSPCPSAAAAAAGCGCCWPGEGEGVTAAAAGSPGAPASPSCLCVTPGVAACVGSGAGG